MGRELKRRPKEKAGGALEPHCSGSGEKSDETQTRSVMCHAGEKATLGTCGP